MLRSASRLLAVGLLAACVSLAGCATFTAHPHLTPNGVALGITRATKKTPLRFGMRFGSTFGATLSAPIDEVYCVSSTLTPCTTSGNPGNGSQGDPAWLAFGKVNAALVQLGLTANDPANEVLATPDGASGIPYLRALVGNDIPAISLAASGNGGVTGTLGYANGGTGLSTLIANDCLAANASANGYDFVTCGSGGSGVTSISGDGALFTNSASTGAVTLTLGSAPGYGVWGNDTAASATPAYTALSSWPAAAFPTLNQNTTGYAASLTSNGYTLPCTVPTLVSGDYLTNNGTTCSWAAVSAGGITLQTNGTNNASQTTLNLVGTGNVSVTNPTGGTVDIGPVSEPVETPITASTYTLTTTDCGKQIPLENTSGVTVTVPGGSTFDGCQVDFTVPTGYGASTLSGSSVTINGNSTVSIAVNAQAGINFDGTNWQLVHSTGSGSSGFTLENGGTSLGTVTTLNCSTGTSCSASGGVGTLTATGGSSGYTDITWNDAGGAGAGVNIYTAPGVSGSSEINSNVLPRAGTFTNMSVYITTAATGSPVVITLSYGATPSSISASTTITCTIAVGANTCNVSASQAVSANDVWTIYVSNGGTAATGNVLIGLALQLN